MGNGHDLGAENSSPQHRAAVALDEEVRAVALYGASGRLLELRGHLEQAHSTWPPVRQLTVERRPVSRAYAPSMRESSFTRT